MTSKLALQWLPCQAPGVIGSALGLVDPVSVYCDWVRWKVWSATSISVCQHVKLSEQIRPWDTLACCWDVKQASNQPTNKHSTSLGHHAAMPPGQVVGYTYYLVAAPCITCCTAHVSFKLIIIIIIIIAFKGAITITPQRRELSPTRTLKWPGRNRVQITCNTLSAYHVQVSCYVPLGTKGQLSCKFWQSWNRIYLSFILLAEPLTDEGGEETGEPGENPWRRASQNAKMPEDSSPNWDSNPHSSTGGRLRKQTC